MSTVYNCPILGCTWTCCDDGPQQLDGESEDEQRAHLAFHEATVEHALRTHYEEHEAEEWVRTVQALHAELAVRSVPLLCVGCLSDRWQAEQTAQRALGLLPAPFPLPPINPAATIVEGNALCRTHLSFGPREADPLPGRTRAGIIIGAPQMPGGKN